MSGIGSVHGDDAQESGMKVKRSYGRKETRGALDRSVAITGTSNLSDELRKSMTTSHDSEEGSKFSFGWKEKLAEIDEAFDALETRSRTQLAEADNTMSNTSETPQSKASQGSFTSFNDDSFISKVLTPLTSSPVELNSPSTKPASRQGRNKAISSNSSDEDSHIDDNQVAQLDLKLISNAVPSSSTSSSEAGESKEEVLIALSNADAGTEDTKKKYTSRTSKISKHKGGPSFMDEKGQKIKRLSKKEQRESIKAHARIVSDQTVSVPKKSEQLSINELLEKFKQSSSFPAPSLLKQTTASSDPIQDFTSSPLLRSTDNDTGPQPEAGQSSGQGDSDEDILDISKVLQEQKAQAQMQQEEIARKNRLANVKRRALEIQAIREKGRRSPATDDEDLEVVEVETRLVADKRRSTRAKNYEKRLAGVAGFQFKPSKHSPSEILGNTQSEAMLEHAAESTFGSIQSRRASGSKLGHRDLQAMMLRKASKQGLQLTREKEEEWIRRGGKIPGKRWEGSSTKQMSLGELVDQLAQKKSERNETSESNDGDSDDSDNGSDEDWEPLNRGSTSPLRFGGEDAGPSGIGVRKVLSDPEDNEDVVGSHGQARHLAHRANRMVVSDSDDEGVNERRTAGRILVPTTSVVIEDEKDISLSKHTLSHKGSISSMGESTADEENKENDKRWMFDHGEDKENMVVPRHIPTGRYSRGSSILDLEEQTKRWSMSPRDEANEIPLPSERKPLQAKKLDDSDDFHSVVSVIKCDSPSALRSSSDLANLKPLQPAFGERAGGFSQFFDDDEGVHVDENAPAPLALRQNSDESRLSLQPSFEPKVIDTGNLSDMFSPEPETGHFSRLRRPGNIDEISLTFDTKLQPALEITTQMRLKADAIFEKDQALVLEEADSDRLQSMPELYITENGLLTQTKPDVSTPLVYRSWTPTQKPSGVELQVAGPSTTQRIPLGTLSFVSDTLSPSQPHQLSRLVKGKAREDPFSSIIGHTRTRNAFDEMLHAAQRKDKKEKQKLSKSEYVEAEAQESDEDEIFGFGGPLKAADNDESEDEDQNAIIEGLVDDSAMDAERLGEEKVLEKVKEHQEEDDAALERYHQAAIEGKYRTKRRSGGLGLDDSDSDVDEDDEARRLRQRMYKKRRIEGDSLEALKRDEKSRVFYEAYQRDVQDDDNEDFAHLVEDDMDESDNDENQPPEVVTTSEIHERLREVAQKRKESGRNDKPFDPEDVKWAQYADSSDEEIFDVKEIELPRKAARKAAGDVPELDSSKRLQGQWNDEQLAAWRKEQNGRNLGSTRGAVTVTGHASKATRGGAGIAGNAEDNRQLNRRKVIKQASILASVTEKQSRFGS